VLDSQTPLRGTALKNQMVFKGGTSLSKVFGLIDRFSEDIGAP
jgi:predicted nucleotidyltransferase component of viral defense system